MSVVLDILLVQRLCNRIGFDHKHSFWMCHSVRSMPVSKLDFLELRPVSAVRTHLSNHRFGKVFGQYLFCPVKVVIFDKNPHTLKTEKTLGFNIKSNNFLKSSFFILAHQLLLKQLLIEPRNQFQNAY